MPTQARDRDRKARREEEEKTGTKAKAILRSQYKLDKSQHKR